jgi:glycosyltransferase involved in cell wall biosynthesis
MMPLVSVVIPCHNYDRFLAAAIESALGQSYSEMEVIVVDDGSTDDTAAVAAGYPAVRYVWQANRGQGEASNRGLKEATGEFVLFLDADDVLEARAIEGLVRCLEERPECVLAYGHQQWIDLRGSVITGSAERTARAQTCLQGDPYAYMLRNNNPLRAPGAILHRSDAVRSAGAFAGDLGNAQDLDLNLRLARDHAICCADRIVLSTRVHATRATRNYGVMLKGAVRAQLRQRSFARHHPVYKRDYKAGLKLARSYWGANLARQVISQFRAREMRQALRSLWTLARFAPAAGILEAARGVARRGE